MPINRIVLAGKWKQLKGSIRRRRGELTHNHVDRIMGGLEHHVGLLQERHGILLARFERAAARLRRHPTT